ncbi:hypothetical protein D3C86_2065120 [compost metagenome]
MGMWFTAQDRERAGTGGEDAGHHLDHGRFTGPIGAEIADGLARLNRKGNAVDGADFRVVAREQALYGAAEAGLALELAKGLAHASG